MATPAAALKNNERGEEPIKRGVLPKAVLRVVKPVFTPVDEWVELPEDQIIKQTKGAIIAPLARLYGEPDGSPLDFFIISAKRCYNNDDTRKHFVKYLNYFEKFYDTDHELILIYSRMKMLMDYYTDSYDRKSLISDIKRYILSGPIRSKVRYMNNDNYCLNLQYKHNTNKCLEYDNTHAAIMMEISLFMKILIPVITHYITAKKVANIKEFLLEVYNEVIYSYDTVNIMMKIFETASTNVNMSRSRDSTLWDMQHIRGRNANLHSIESLENVILNIMPKYTYAQNIICFNYNSIINEIQHKVTDISYEYGFTTLSSSRRDEDNNSEFDKFESQQTKQDESKYIQNKVACQETMRFIEMMYGPFSREEIIFHLNCLRGEDGRPAINQFQYELISNLFSKYFGDAVSIKAINQYDYIKLMLAAKKILMANQMIVLPYIISGRVDRLVSKKNINKKEQIRLEASTYYPMIQQKYKNEKIEKHILSIIAQILASEFSIIDYNDDDYHGKRVPNIPDYICEEVLQFVLLI